MTNRNLLIAAGGGTTFDYPPPPPPPDPQPDPPPDPDPDPEPPTPEPPPPPPNPPGGIQGFGARVTGGAGYPEVHVTNLNDGGSGSFKQACLGGNRTIVFDVSGTINHSGSAAYVDYDNITIAGETAPGSGINFRGYPIFIRAGADNIIVRHIRHLGDPSLAGTQEGDGITVGNNDSGATNVLIHNCSFTQWADEAVGIWGPYNRDITVTACIMRDGGDPTHEFGGLIGGPSAGGLRSSWYRNLFARLEYRQPAIGWNDTGSGFATEIAGDVINNLIWAYTGWGTSVYYGGKANVVKNYYYTTDSAGGSQAIELGSADQGGLAFISGNYSKDGSSFPSSNASRFSVRADATITEATAQTAAAQILTTAGCRVGGLSSGDAALIASILSTGL